MNLLNITSVAFWLFLAYQSISVFRAMRCAKLAKKEVTAITVLLLCGLNIAWNVVSIFVETGVIFSSGQKLLGYLCFGMSVFQLLLANFVLDHINDNTNNNTKD